MQPLHAPGSAYVLLHHVMGQALHYDNVQGDAAVGSTWAYARGGMGAVSGAIAKAAEAAGAEILTSCDVNRILVSPSHSGEGRLGGVTRLPYKKPMQFLSIIII